MESVIILFKRKDEVQEMQLRLPATEPIYFLP